MTLKSCQMEGEQITLGGDWGDGPFLPGLILSQLYSISTAVSLTDKRLVKLQHLLMSHTRSKSVSLFKLCFLLVRVPIRKLKVDSFPSNYLVVQSSSGRCTDLYGNKYKSTSCFLMKSNTVSFKLPLWLYT